MKALLLAAGKATRLGLISRSVPKCMQMVGDEVILDRLVRQLKDVGVTEFLINTHHLAQQVAHHISERSDRDMFTLTYEPRLLGTLATLTSNSAFFHGEPTWVLHADNWIGGTLDDMRTRFEERSRSQWGVMLAFQSSDPSSCGIAETDTDDMLISFHEKAVDPPSRTASAATFLFDHRVLELAESLPPRATDLSTHLLPQLIGRIRVIHHSAEIIDIGTPEGLELARTFALQKKQSQGHA